ncbi:type IV pilin protein [Wenzhouxiangella sp. XN24]|uniref:type IV pilin protein n=1 Tax=Wenzhouxiangella sp. XN24 TaxID=2713569 RepID=UPI0013EAD7AC|nr:type IV pilin protein [Wenzhouxiangella sp. XN24]NGX17280.1 prepilin-type N-terminal cleavage/methylation domain-containing protein [Wenzhouxiangella sp. XN24]
MADSNRGSVRAAGGFTLLELMMALVVVSLIAAIAIPAYQGAVNRARTAQAVATLTELSAFIERYRSDNFAFPPDLAALGRTIPSDPWGNPYVYLNIAIGVPRGMVRKDRNLNPLNSDFDLYSLGPDGVSSLALTARAARDDILRAGNGAFIGLAADH